MTETNNCPYSPTLLCALRHLKAVGASDQQICDFLNEVNALEDVAGGAPAKPAESHHRGGVLIPGQWGNA